MNATQIIYTALVWAEESMAQMIGGSPAGDYRTKLTQELKEMKAYRVRRFGVGKNPFEGCKAVTLNDLRLKTKRRDRSDPEGGIPGRGP